MSSPTISSPTYRNLRLKNRQSPVELKEKMRKSYKDKVQNCRNMLLNRLRGTSVDNELRNTLTNIYKTMFSFSNNEPLDEEENEILEIIKNELVQEELEWWTQEYEKSQLENVDWSSIEQSDGVICPVCQKTNFNLLNNMLSCSNCKYNIKTTKTLLDIKHCILNSVDRHSSLCNHEIQFSLLSEATDSHIYLICDTCMEMQVLV